MAIRPLYDDLNIIAALPDEPTDSSAVLKAKFDKAGNLIQDYINESLIPDIGADVAAAIADAEINSGNIPSGGTTGQILKKNSDTNYDYGWADMTGASAPTPNTFVQRDANGRFQAANPSAAQDVATKNYVDSGQPIGKITMALTNPWGANGLLCNGGEIVQATYPVLYSLTSTSLGGPWKTSATPANALVVTVLNGYIVAFNGAQIYYKPASAPSSAWTTVVTNITNSISYITYGNGYWVVTTSGTLQMWYLATSGAPTATWTQNTTHGIPTSTQTWCNLIYANGTFVMTYVASNMNSTLWCAHKSSSPIGAWTTGVNTSATSGGGYGATLSYWPEASKYVLQGTFYNGTYYMYWARYSSDLSNWYSIFQDNNAANVIAQIQYYNGIWYAVKNSGGIVQNDNLSNLASSNSIIVSVLPVSYTLLRLNNRWVAYSDIDVYENKTSDPTSSQSWVKYTGVTPTQTQWIGYQAGMYIGFGGGTNFWYTPPAVPNVSAPGYYAFIKAL